MTIPFNEHRLWKGKMQLANYPKSPCKPEMVLFPLKYHNGQGNIDGKELTKIYNVLSSNLSKSYSAYSKKYWDQVNERKELYRALRTID